MGRKKKHPEHENLERWLVSYADFITLLFATFTALFAMSQLDIAKFKVAGHSLNEAFNGSPYGMYDSAGGGASFFPNPGGGAQTLSIQPIQFTEQKEKFIQAAQAFNKMIEESDIKIGATGKGLAGEVYASFFPTRGLVITILTNEGKVYFRPGSADLEPAAFPVLERIGELLKSEFAGFDTDVEGHCDSSPINNPYFPSNWELSLCKSLQCS